MENTIAIIGLGYVGLPLATEFAKKYKVVGFDIDKSRIDDLLNYQDKTGETSIVEFKNVLRRNIQDFSRDKEGLLLSSNISDISDVNIFILTVPTPINHKKEPDLSFLLSATKMISSLLKKGDLVIYESTVYPGCTEEECVPVLESGSGLSYNKDFFCGYSPERISPGDTTHTLINIKKVTSGSNVIAAKKVDSLYQSIIKAGTYLAPSIKVAEASKAIENAQRDLNISFVNELALIFDRIGVDTHEVLDAAKTKWNFIPFSPGLVGGHCISVDPYYLTYKSKKLGYNPSVILSGRDVNNSMGEFIASKTMQLMLKKGLVFSESNLLILGVTFKENCPDIRNTQVKDIYNRLSNVGVDVDIYDPQANNEMVKQELGIDLINSYGQKKYSVLILAVSHKEFLNIDFKKFKEEGVIILDTKSVISKEYVDYRL